MAHHDAIRSYRSQSVPGVEHRFALLDAGTGRLHQRRHCAQRLSSKLERRPSASRRFVKQKHDPLAAQQRTHFQRIHAAGQPEQTHDLLRVEMFNPEQGTASRHIHWKECKRCIIRGRRAPPQGRRPHSAESGGKMLALQNYGRSRRPTMAAPSAPPRVPRKRKIIKPKINNKKIIRTSPAGDRKNSHVGWNCGSE